MPHVAAPPSLAHCVALSCTVKSTFRMPEGTYVTVRPLAVSRLQLPPPLYVSYPT